MRVNCPICGRFMTIIAKDKDIYSRSTYYEIGCKTCKIKQDLSIPDEVTKHDHYIREGLPVEKWIHNQMKWAIKNYGIDRKEEKE